MTSVRVDGACPSSACSASCRALRASASCRRTWSCSVARSTGTAASRSRRSPAVVARGWRSFSTPWARGSSACTQAVTSSAQCGQAGIEGVRCRLGATRWPPRTDRICLGLGGGGKYGGPARDNCPWPQQRVRRRRPTCPAALGATPGPVGSTPQPGLVDRPAPQAQHPSFGSHREVATCAQRRGRLRSEPERASPATASL
jgi:hypothetical protein